MRMRVVLAFSAIFIVWGSTYLAIRYAVAEIPPLLTAGIRHLTAGSVLYIWRARRATARRRQSGRTVRSWARSSFSWDTAHCIGPNNRSPRGSPPSSSRPNRCGLHSCSPPPDRRRFAFKPLPACCSALPGSGRCLAWRRRAAVARRAAPSQCSLAQRRGEAALCTRSAPRFRRTQCFGRRRRSYAARCCCSPRRPHSASTIRIVVSAETDFGALLAASSSRKPSVILFRGEGSRTPEVLARTLLANLSQVTDALESGSIITFEPARVRVRALPIGTRTDDE
jgi:hypothetical protein